MAKIIKTSMNSIDETVYKNVQKFLKEALAGNTLGTEQPAAAATNYASPTQQSAGQAPAQQTNNQQAGVATTNNTNNIAQIKEKIVDILYQLSSNSKAFPIQGLIQTVENAQTEEQIRQCLIQPQGGLKTYLVNAYSIYVQIHGTTGLDKNEYNVELGQILEIPQLSTLVNTLETFLGNCGFISANLDSTTIVDDYTGGIKYIQQQIAAFRKNPNVITAFNTKGKTCINIFDKKYNNELRTASQSSVSLLQWFAQTVIVAFFENTQPNEAEIESTLPHIHAYPTQITPNNFNDIDTYFQNVIADVTGFSQSSNATAISSQIYEVVATAINEKEYFGNEMLKGEDGGSLQDFKTLMTNPENINDNVKASSAAYTFLKEWFGRHHNELINTQCDGEERNLINALNSFNQRVTKTSGAVRVSDDEWAKWDNQNLTLLKQTLEALRAKFNSEKERVNQVPFTVLMEEQESFYASINNKQSFLCEDKLFVPAAQSVNNFSYNNPGALNEGVNDKLWPLDKYALPGKSLREVDETQSTVYRAISYAHRRIGELNGGDKNVTITPEIITKIMAADYMFNEVTAQKYLQDIFSTYRRADRKTQQLIAQRVQMLENNKLFGTNSLMTTENNLQGEYRIELLPKNEAEFTKNIAARQKVAAKYAGPLAKAFLYYYLYVGHSSIIKGIVPQPVFIPAGLNSTAGAKGKAATSFKQVVYVPDIDGIQEVMFKNGSAGNVVKYWKLNVDSETVTVKATPDEKEVYDLLFKPNSPIRELKKHPMIEQWKQSIDSSKKNYGCYESISKAQQKAMKEAYGKEKYKILSLGFLFKDLIGGDTVYDEKINYGKLLSQVAVYKSANLEEPIIFNVVKLAEYVATQIQNNPSGNYSPDDLEYLLRYTNVIPEEYMKIIMTRMQNVSISSRSDKHYTSGYNAKDDDNFNVTRIKTPEHEKTVYNITPEQQFGQVGQQDGKVNVSKKTNHKAVTPKKQKNKDPHFGPMNESVQKMVSLINRMNDPNKQREYLR